MRPSNVFELLPRLAVNGPFIAEVLAHQAPCCALGMVDERKERFAALMLSLDVPLPNESTAHGFSLGHSVLGTQHVEVLQFSFIFYGFRTYHVLVNPNNPIVQAVVGRMVERGEYFILAIGVDGTATAFQAGVGQGELLGVTENIDRLRASRTTDREYDQALAQFRQFPQPSGQILEWVCRDNLACLDPSLAPLDMSPASPRAPETTEEDEARCLAAHLAGQITALGRVSDIELFTAMAEEMPLFKRMMEIAGHNGLNALCREHPALDRYARLLESIAQGIASGDIVVPR
ncbi:MAG: hypothetical protein WBP72_05510 [Rhodocyclaceae bacterium]